MLIRVCFGTFLKEYSFNDFCCANENISFKWELPPVHTSSFSVPTCFTFTLCHRWQFPSADLVLSAVGHWADPLQKSGASALLRGTSAAVSGSLATSMNAEITLLDDFHDGYHCTRAEQHIPVCFISLYLTNMSLISNIMQSYATFDSLTVVKRLIPMDFYCSIVYNRQARIRVIIANRSIWGIEDLFACVGKMRHQSFISTNQSWHLNLPNDGGHGIRINWLYFLKKAVSLSGQHFPPQRLNRNE